MTIPPDPDGPPYPEWPAPDPRKPQERDEKGRIKKGSSGNYKGRPPQAVRALTTRELNREIIAESERLLEVGGES